MRLNPEFIEQKVGSSTMLIPIGKAAKEYRGIIQLNETAAFIVSCLKKNTSVEQICVRLGEEYNGTEADFKASTELTLQRLREAHALIEP